MKLYTFLDEAGKIIVEQRAENHDQAVERVSQHGVEWLTDFYSETISE